MRIPLEQVCYNVFKEARKLYQRRLLDSIFLLGGIMKKYIVLATAMVFILACSMLSPSTPAPAPTQAQIPASTETPIPPTATTAPTDLPTPTVGPSETPTLAPLFIPTADILPQQWNGFYTYATGQKQRITLYIEKVDGAKFSGKTIWASFGNFRGAILKMNGEYVTDFGDRIEQTKWKNLEDYGLSDKTGIWLKWTETDIIDGGNYTVNGWYYGHIRENETMVAVYFYNDKETVADTGNIVLELVTH
jgi:hypothetical protein